MSQVTQNKIQQERIGEIIEILYHLFTIDDTLQRFFINRNVEEKGTQPK